MSGSINLVQGGSVYNSEYQWLNGTNPNNSIIFVAPVPAAILCIVGRVEVAEGSASTVTVTRAPSGTSLANGTAMGPTFNCNGTAYVPQYVLQWGVAGQLALNAGDTLGLRTTGSFSNNICGIAIYWQAL